MYEKKYKTGYLKEDFRIFYLKTVEKQTFSNHFHDFHKLLFLLNGNISYYIEGEIYELLPDDLILIPAGEMHRPVIHDGASYERLILYISPAFFDRYQEQGFDLYELFSRCQKRGSHTLRIAGLKESRIHTVLEELIANRLDENFAAPLYLQSLLLELLILLNRTLENQQLSFPSAARSNRRIVDVLSYINSHLDDPSLSVDTVAAHCYLNRSYLMHLFRQETGYTIGNYLTEKRLFTARQLIQQGFSVTEACMRSGFTSYASFYRSYRKKFSEPPKNSRRS